ncbi:MAG: hypothetical protein EB060_04570 [Proteobacteria bacterium]|nr:hypothetical protein [Pseudomonadota bacterium]
MDTGQKQRRTMMREQLEAEGVDLAALVAQGIIRAQESGDEHILAEYIKMALPYCYRKLPAEHEIHTNPPRIDYSEVLLAHGIPLREDCGGTAEANGM